MKRIIVLILLINFSLASATNIEKLEYFIDNDPGFGNGTDIPISPDSVITSNFTIDLSGETDGFHFIYSRVKDENGNWSHNNTRPVYKNEENIIVNIEEIQLYFTGSDADPTDIFSITDFIPESNIEEFITQSMYHLAEDEDYCMHIYVIDENGKSSLEQLLNFTLDLTPRNIIVSIVNGEITINWNEVIGADSYEVYSSNDLSIPQSSWSPEEVGIIDTLWSEQTDVDKKFYYLKSISEDQSIRRGVYHRRK